MLKEATFNTLRARPFTKIVGRKPTWRQAKNMIKEMMDTALSFAVTYDWAGNFRLLAEIVGAVNYATDSPTLEHYIRDGGSPESALTSSTPTCWGCGSAAMLIT